AGTLETWHKIFKHDAGHDVEFAYNTGNKIPSWFQENKNAQFWADFYDPRFLLQIIRGEPIVRLMDMEGWPGGADYPHIALFCNFVNEVSSGRLGRGWVEIERRVGEEGIDFEQAFEDVVGLSLDEAMEQFYNQLLPIAINSVDYVINLEYERGSIEEATGVDCSDLDAEGLKGVLRDALRTKAIAEKQASVAEPVVSPKEKKISPAKTSALELIKKDVGLEIFFDGTQLRVVSNDKVLDLPEVPDEYIIHTLQRPLDQFTTSVGIFEDDGNSLADLVRGKEIAVIGPGPSLIEAREWLRREPEIQAIHVVELDRDNFTGIFEEWLTLSSRERQRIRLHRADGRHMPFDDEKFAVVYTASIGTDVLGNEGTIDLLKEIERVVAPNGAIIGNITLSGIRDLPNVLHDINLSDKGVPYDVLYYAHKLPVLSLAGADEPALTGASYAERQGARWTVSVMGQTFKGSRNEVRNNILNMILEKDDLSWDEGDAETLAGFLCDLEIRDLLNEVKIKAEQKYGAIFSLYEEISAKMPEPSERNMDRQMLEILYSAWTGDGGILRITNIIQKLERKELLSSKELQQFMAGCKSNFFMRPMLLFETAAESRGDWAVKLFREFSPRMRQLRETFNTIFRNISLNIDEDPSDKDRPALISAYVSMLELEIWLLERYIAIGEEHGVPIETLLEFSQFDPSGYLSSRWGEEKMPNIGELLERAKEVIQACSRAGKGLEDTAITQAALAETAPPGIRHFGEIATSDGVISYPLDMFRVLAQAGEPLTVSEIMERLEDSRAISDITPLIARNLIHETDLAGTLGVKYSLTLPAEVRADEIMELLATLPQGIASLSSDWATIDQQINDILAQAVLAEIVSPGVGHIELLDERILDLLVTRHELGNIMGSISFSLEAIAESSLPEKQVKQIKKAVRLRTRFQRSFLRLTEHVDRIKRGDYDPDRITDEVRITVKELHSIVTEIETFITSIMSGSAADKTFEEIILNRCRQADRLLTEFISGKKVLNLEEIDLKVTLAARSDYFRDTWRRQGKNLVIVEDYPEELPVTVDAKKIDRAITNLINNASEAMPDGGEITISAASAEDGVVIRISDTGRGMSPESVEKFRQGTIGFSTKQEEKGMVHGLGLYVVRSIVNAHHGTIDIETGPGKGTTFTITLPITQPSSPQIEVKVLVLDDVPDMLEATKATIACPEVREIKTAQSIEQGLEALERNPDINFLVLDFRLRDYPAENGVEFCRQAFSTPYNFTGKVVLYSADDMAVINELKRHPDLWDRYQDGQISIQLEHSPNATHMSNAFELIRAKIVAFSRGEEIGIKGEVDIAEIEQELPLGVLDIQPEDIGVTSNIVDRFRDCHVIIADDKPFIRNAIEATVSGFFDMVHKAGTAENTVALIKSLRAEGVPDERIIILADFEFGTEQTGIRRKDGRDLLNITRLHPNAGYPEEVLNFKGYFFFVSGSIISKDQIPGFDKSEKDIDPALKERYGIDYKEKNADEDFPIDLLKMVYRRLQDPYDLSKDVLEPLPSRPMSKPADVSFLNGGVNDFEVRMKMGLRALKDSLSEIRGEAEDIEAHSRIEAQLSKMSAFFEFGNVSKDLPFNARTHNYKGRIFYVAGYLIPETRKEISLLNPSDRQKYRAFIEQLDNLILTLSVAENYMLRLLRLSATVGNVERAVGLEDFMKTTIGAFLSDYGEEVTIETDFDEDELSNLEFPYGLTFIVSYLLDNAHEQYRIKYGRDFKGVIYFKINKEKEMLEVSILDEAGGIPDDILPYIFLRKFTTKPHGTGYGLFWAKKLIHMFDGDITAHNEGEGACFTVMLPLKWQHIIKKKEQVPERLVQGVFHILRERGNPEADELAEPLAREIYSYSAKIAEITKTRETISYDFIRSSYVRLNIETMLSRYFQATCTGDPELFRTIIFEKGTTEEEVGNLLLSLLALKKVEAKDDITFTHLPERQAVALDYDDFEGQAKILLRSEENISRESEGIASERRKEYQRLLRQIGYSIHKISGTDLAIMGANVKRIKEISKEKKDELLDLFYQELPQRILLQLIHQYTSSGEQLSGFEEDILTVERIDGWYGAISDLLGAITNLKQRLDRELEGIQFVDKDRAKEIIEIIERTANDARSLSQLLNKEKIKDKEFMDIASYLDGQEQFHFTVTPGTRLWLKSFFLKNIMLNILKSKPEGEDISVTVSEEDGYTVFDINYKEHVDTETMFESKTKGEPWYRGPLVLDLVDAVDGEIRAENVGENVEITIRFPLPKLPSLGIAKLGEKGDAKSQYPATVARVGREEETPDITGRVLIERDSQKGYTIAFDYDPDTETTLAKEEQDILRHSLRDWIATLDHAPPEEIPIFASYDLDQVAEHKPERIEINRALLRAPPQDPAERAELGIRHTPEEHQLFIDGVIWHEGFHFLNPAHSEEQAQQATLEFFESRPDIRQATINVLDEDNQNLIHGLEWLKKLHGLKTIEVALRFDAYSWGTGLIWGTDEASEDLWNISNQFAFQLGNLKKHYLKSEYMSLTPQEKEVFEILGELYMEITWREPSLEKMDEIIERIIAISKKEDAQALQLRMNLRQLYANYAYVAASFIAGRRHEDIAHELKNRMEEIVGDLMEVTPEAVINHPFWGRAISFMVEHYLPVEDPQYNNKPIQNLYL
ncbi:GHKL domain-containing protein, partial [bacterium]|nr:GHKL domain-containing protein [bacterium]